MAAPENRPVYRNSANKNPATKKAAYRSPQGAQRRAQRERIYRKSRLYRRQQRKRKIACGAGAAVLLLILVLSVHFFLGKRSDVDAKGDASNVSSTIGEAAGADMDRLQADSVSEKTNKDADGASGETDGTAAGANIVQEPVTLTVSVVGDCTLGTDESFDYSTSLNAYYENYGPDYFLANVRDIFSGDDLTIANFEGTLTNSEERADKQFAFKAPPEFAKILSGSSVETVNTANNHSHDYGDRSFADTMAALDAEGIVHFGYDETAVVDVKGIKVGLVGIYELNDHLERAEQLKANIARVKEKGAQLTIVIFHWGNEKEDVPDENQITLGRMAIDEGADLVCGHHPHVLQGMESYKGKQIVYSLGNFCFGGNSYPSDMDTIIYQQTFTIDQDGVKADSQVNIIPCSISSEYGYNNYQPTPAQDEEADRILRKFEERSSWI